MSKPETPFSGIDTVVVRHVSKCNIKPHLSDQPSSYYLSAWDIPTLEYDYIKYCLCFAKPQHLRMPSVIHLLKTSLAATLAHFFPLSGRFVTQNIPAHPPSYSVYVDCKDSPGAEFVVAAADQATLSDVLNPTDGAPAIIDSLFALRRTAVNKQGHTLPLLAVQVTELADGVVVAFSMNHALVDGCSYWHFVNSWSQVCKSRNISRPPITNRWFLKKQDCIFEAAELQDASAAELQDASSLHEEAIRVRVFHFTSDSVTRLKAKANLECHGGANNISRYQALAALLWRLTTRAWGMQGDETTTCVIPVDSRLRMEPPLGTEYFGNYIISEFVESRADELLRNNLGWAASRLHNQILNHDNRKVRSFLQGSGFTHSISFGSGYNMFLANSPRFDVYGNDFGWGKPAGVRWHPDRIDGVVHLFCGREQGSVDMEVSLCSEFMNVFESDGELMDAVSVSVSVSPLPCQQIQVKSAL